MSFNTFKSTHIYGEFVNEDSPDASLTASASFQRDVYIGGNLVVPGLLGHVPITAENLIQLNGELAKVTNDTLSVPTLSCTNVFSNTNLSGPYVFCDSIVQNATLKSGQQVGGKFAIDQSGTITCSNLMAAANLQAPFMYAESIGQIGASPKFYMSANGDLTCNSVTCQDYTPILHRVQSNANLWSVGQIVHHGDGIVFSNPAYTGVGYAAEKWGCVGLNDDDSFGIFADSTDIIMTTGDSHSIQIASPLIKLLCDSLNLRECGAIACERFASDTIECTTLECENLTLTGIGEVTCDTLTCNRLYTPNAEFVTDRENTFTERQTIHHASGLILSNPANGDPGVTQSSKYGHVRMSTDEFSISATNADVRISTSKVLSKVVVESPQVQIETDSFSIECSAPIAIPPAVSSGCVVHNANIGCYFFSTVDNDWHAVLCSRLNLGTTYRRTDLYWWVGPGFKIILFGSANYQDPVHQSIDNTNGVAPIFETPLHPTDCVAVKILYRGGTIQFEPLSIFFP
jgi:hypothetical protein